VHYVTYISFKQNRHTASRETRTLHPEVYDFLLTATAHQVYALKMKTVTLNTVTEDCQLPVQLCMRN